jgi:hypothetical protein
LASTGWFSEPQRAVRTILPARYRHRSSIAFFGGAELVRRSRPLRQGDGHEEFLPKNV